MEAGRSTWFVFDGSAHPWNQKEVLISSNFLVSSVSSVSSLADSLEVNTSCFSLHLIRSQSAMRDTSHSPAQQRCADIAKYSKAPVWASEEIRNSSPLTRMNRLMEINPLPIQEKNRPIWRPWCCREWWRRLDKIPPLWHEVLSAERHHCERYYPESHTTTDCMHKHHVVNRILKGFFFLVHQTRFHGISPVSCCKTSLINRN